MRKSDLAHELTARGRHLLVSAEQMPGSARWRCSMTGLLALARAAQVLGHADLSAQMLKAASTSAWYAEREEKRTWN